MFWFKLMDMDDFKHLTYYELLGISRDATLEEIKRAYRQQIARYHPDYYSNASAQEQAYASERTQHINEAYNILTDMKKRAMYNQKSIESARPRPRADYAAAAQQSRDYQAELYEQATDHLNAGRSMQAVATLQELQKINPFYRDSATLLARAKDSLQNEAAAPSSAPYEQPQQTATPHTAEQTQTNRRSPLPIIIGSLGILALLGLIAVFFVLPQIQVNSANTNTEPATTATPQTAAGAPTQVPPTTVATSTPASQPAQQPATPPSSAQPAEEPAAAASGQSPDVRAKGTLLERYDFTQGDEWATMQGDTWRVGPENGTYRISVESGMGNIWSYHTSPAGMSYRLGADVQVQGGAGGLVMHYLDSNNYVAFLIDPANTTYWIEHHHEGTTTTIAEGTSQTIQPDETSTNRLEAVLEGSIIQVAINNSPIDTLVIDNLAPTEQYGLLAKASEQSTTAWFDNVEIRTVR